MADSERYLPRVASKKRKAKTRRTGSDEIVKHALAASKRKAAPTPREALAHTHSLMPAFLKLTNQPDVRPLAAHASHAFQLFAFIVQAAQAGSPLYVKRLRVLHAEMQRMVKSDRAYRLAQTIENARRAYHETHDDEERLSAIHSVINMLLLLNGDGELADITEDHIADVREVLEDLSRPDERKGSASFGIGRAAHDLAPMFGGKALTAAAYNKALERRR